MRSSQLLLDTCTFIWLTAAPERLGKAARKALEESRQPLLLSDVSILELCLKWKAGKLGLPQPPRIWVEDQARIWRLGRAPLNPETFYRVTEMAQLHGDPFDRLLIGQAMSQGLTIVTPDRAIRQYPVATLW